jgi:hypothetical protein
MNQQASVSPSITIVPVRSPNEVAAGSKGMMMLKVPSAAAFIDVDPAPHVNVLTIHAGKRELNAHADRSWRELLAEARLNAGDFITIIAENSGTEPRALEARLAFVVAEASGDRRQASGQTRAQMSGQTRGQMPGQMPPGYGRQVPTADRRATSDKRGTVTHIPGRVTGHMNGRIPGRTDAARPASVATVSSINDARLGVSRAQRRPTSRVNPRGVATNSTMDKAAARPSVTVTPEPGEHAVLLLSGHAYGLMRLAKYRVLLHKAFAPTVLRALRQALVHTGPRPQGGGEVVVCLRPDAIGALIRAVENPGAPLGASTPDIIVALRRCLESRVQSRESENQSETGSETAPDSALPSLESRVQSRESEMVHDSALSTPLGSEPSSLGSEPSPLVSEVSNSGP